LREAETRALEALDIDGMVDYLCSLIAVPSTGGRETEAQSHVAAELRRIGFSVDTWEIDFDEARRHPSFSMGIPREEGVGVVGTMGGEEGRSLILNGHIDVVSAGDESNWTHPPWKGTVEDGLIYGRGTVDMKGGLVCAFYAAKAIRDAGVKLKGKLILESAIGEEDGGVGTLAAVLRGYRADGAIIMEPSELNLVAAQAGALAFRVTVQGKSAHACVREEGVSAIEKFIPLHDALRALEAERNRGINDPLYRRYSIPYPLSVGKVQGGNWPGSVAESLFFEGRIGVPVGERIEEARRSLEEAIRKASERDAWLMEHPPRVEWIGYQFKPASIPARDPVVETVAGSFRDVAGRAPSVEGVTYSSDMHYLVYDAETPTLLFGPGNVRRSHSPDECVPVSDLVTVARTLCLTAMRFCGIKE
jgi:acetylornithine deacetylase